jgi:RNase P/RNase MRP subunit p29
LIDIRENVVNKNEINYQSLVGEFININNSNILIVAAGHVTTEPRNTLVIRLDVDKKELCLSKAIFRKWLVEEKNVSPKQWMQQMKQIGTEVVEKRKRLATNWKQGMDQFNIDAFIINTDTINKDIIGVIDPELA